MSDCASLLANALPNQAEPFAVETDLSQASVELEIATMAPDTGTAAAHLSNVAMWLNRAAAVYASGERSPELADDVNCALNQVTQWQASVSSWGDLATFQQTQLYPFQGVLSQLMNQAIGRQGRDAAIVSFGVLALVILVYAGEVHREYQRARGTLTSAR